MSEHVVFSRFDIPFSHRKFREIRCSLREGSRISQNSTTRVLYTWYGGTSHGLQKRYDPWQKGCMAALRTYDTNKDGRISPLEVLEFLERSGTFEMCWFHSQDKCSFLEGVQFADRVYQHLNSIWSSRESIPDPAELFNVSRRLRLVLPVLNPSLCEKELKTLDYSGLPEKPKCENNIEAKRAEYKPWPYSWGYSEGLDAHGIDALAEFKRIQTANGCSDPISCMPFAFG